MEPGGETPSDDFCEKIRRQYELTIKTIRLMEFNESDYESFLDRFTLFASDVDDGKIYFKDNFIGTKYEYINKLDPRKHIQKIKNNKGVTYYLIHEWTDSILLNEKLYNKCDFKIIEPESASDSEE